MPEISWMEKDYLALPRVKSARRIKEYANKDLCSSPKTSFGATGSWTEADFDRKKGVYGTVAIANWIREHRDEKVESEAITS